MNPVLTAFLTGLGTAVPAPFLPLFTPEELEVLLCGKPDIDIELLKKVHARSMLDVGCAVWVRLKVVLGGVRWC